MLVGDFSLRDEETPVYSREAHHVVGYAIQENIRYFEYPGGLFQCRSLLAFCFWSYEATIKRVSDVVKALEYLLFLEMQKFRSTGPVNFSTRNN